MPITPITVPSVPPLRASRPRKEWKSWKIGYPWLSLILFIVLSLSSVIVSLDIVSRHNSGFAHQSKAPPLLARNPAVERAIWSQGILYTAFPAFIMTIYRTMWEASVSAIAERQPYVDMKKPGGGPPRSTIMLDYKAEPSIYSWVVALRNRHLLLAACMFSSVLLTFVVIPLTSFLFTTASFVSSATFPLYFETSFNSTVLGPFPTYPDLRRTLDSAAAMRIQNASRPPWTDGEFAVAKFVPLVNIEQGNVTLVTTAYSAHSDCIVIPETQYEKTILTPGDTGIPALSIGISANDRGCHITNFLNIRLTENHPNNFVRLWTTTSCNPDAGWSRFSILTAVYKDSSSGVANFSLISCAPSYQITPGTLVATMDIGSAPALKSFTPDTSKAQQTRWDDLWEFFEEGIHTFGCFDPMSGVDSNEFGQHVYRISSQKNTTSPLSPETIGDAAEILFSTTFAVFASTVLFRPTNSPQNGTGVRSLDEMRLIVVSPIAYIILAILIIVAGLNVSLFFYARQESMLCEEPVGLLSMSAILRKSDVNVIVEDIASRAGYNGKIKSPAVKEFETNHRDFVFDKTDNKIIEIRRNY